MNAVAVVDAVQDEVQADEASEVQGFPNPQQAFYLEQINRDFLALGDTLGSILENVPGVNGERLCAAMDLTILAKQMFIESLAGVTHDFSEFIAQKKASAQADESSAQDAQKA